jgi:hypothetical protein
MSLSIAVDWDFFVAITEVVNAIALAVYRLA